MSINLHNHLNNERTVIQFIVKEDKEIILWCNLVSTKHFNIVSVRWRRSMEKNIWIKSLLPFATLYSYKIDYVAMNLYIFNCHVATFTMHLSQGEGRWELSWCFESHLGYPVCSCSHSYLYITVFYLNCSLSCSLPLLPNYCSIYVYTIIACVLYWLCYINV